MADMMNDATAYGGRMSGFDPAYEPQVGSDAIWQPSLADFDFGAMPDIASEYGTGYGPSSGVYGEASRPNVVSNWDQFWDDPSNPLSKVGKALFGQTVGKAIPGAGTALGFASAKTPREMSQSMLGTGGGILGSMLGGPLGGLVGGSLGNFIGSKWEGNGQPYNGQTSNAGTGSGGLNFGDVAGGLGSLWAASQANKGLSGAGGNNSAVNAQIESLSSMYGPNSPYAAQLRQTLERKDAAAGRRSQYGPREVQLQAALADKQAGVADTIGRLATSGQNNQMALNNQRNQTRAQQLALLANLGKKSGLLDMFSSGGGSRGQPSGYIPNFSGLGSGGVSTDFSLDVPDNYDWNQYSGNSLFGG